MNVAAGAAGVPSPLVWKGTVTSGTVNTWDVINSDAWLNAAVGDNFYQADSAIFNSSDAVPTVSIAAAVKPLSVTVSVSECI